MTHASSVERPPRVLAFSGEVPQICKLSVFSLKRQTPDVLALGWPIRPKIIGHLMVRQSNTVCRNVRRKPAHSVEHKGFRIFGWSLPAPCKLPQREKTRQKAKTTPVSREERGWRSSSKSMLHLQMSNVCQILFRPTALLFIPHTTLLTAPSVPSQEDIRVLNQAAPAYLHSRKPEVPSGPLGWRITWLFERTGSSGCCTLIQAGLIMVREKLE